jgi:hypothetical protein
MRHGRESYVVHIYRRLDDPPKEPVGLIERVEDGRRTSFRGFEELKRVLSTDGLRGRRSCRLRPGKEEP